MRASKRFVTVPVIVSICIAMLWGLCAIGVAKIYPTASQSTSTHRLAYFSGTTLTLVNRLQQERAAVSAFLSADDPAALDKRARKSAKNTDRYYTAFRKSIGRFNSDDYGAELTAALKEADALIQDLPSFRTRIRESAVSAEDAVEHYSRIISMLSKSILQLGMQPLSRGASDQSKKAYLKIFQAVELASRDMADGAAFIHGRQTGANIDSAWPQISDREHELLKEYRSLAGEQTGKLYDVWSGSKEKSAADSLRGALAQGTVPTSAGGTYSIEKWFKVFRASMMGLHSITATQQRDFAKSVGGDAIRSAYLFITLMIFASLATLVAIAWFRPDYFRSGLLAALLVSNLAFIAWAYAVGPDWLLKENGPLESLQAFALAAAFFIFCADTVNSKDAPRVVAVIFTCACFLLFFREFDFRVYGAPEWLISVSSGAVRRILFVSIIASLLVYVVTQRRHFNGMVQPMLKWTAWPFLLWLPLLLTGEVIEYVTHATQKDDVLGYWANGQFWEELLELNAYLVLLFGAYVFGEIYGLRTRRDSEARLKSLRCALAAKGSRQG